MTYLKRNRFQLRAMTPALALLAALSLAACGGGGGGGGGGSGVTAADATATPTSTTAGTLGAGADAVAATSVAAEANTGTASALDKKSNGSGRAPRPVPQPANTEGRLLASNCFQCHGTMGTGGFESIRGKDVNEVLEFMTKTASKDIMAAHAQGYTQAQLQKIIAYLQQ